MRMFVDVGKALLDNSIQCDAAVGGSTRRSPLISSEIFSPPPACCCDPCQNGKTGSEPEVIDLGRTEGA